MNEYTQRSKYTTAATATLTMSSEQIERYTTPNSGSESLPEESDPPACIICFEMISSVNGSAITSCGHTYCLSCLLLSLKYNNRCPMCRKNITERQQKIPRMLDLTVCVPAIEHCFNSFGAQTHLDSIMHFGHPRASFKTAMIVFGIELANRLIAVQHSDPADDDDIFDYEPDGFNIYDDEYEDDTDDESAAPSQANAADNAARHIPTVSAADSSSDDESVEDLPRRHHMPLVRTTRQTPRSSATHLVHNLTTAPRTQAVDAAVGQPATPAPAHALIVASRPTPLIPGEFWDAGKCGLVAGMKFGVTIIATMELVRLWDAFLKI